ncbi:hypothetical protein VE25_10345 [Devosia geojensis]|uniref:Co-chaperone DjlA N-terminal domain-containing protein n=1 Tax=Devosia geojensis TaxID=443610 RepID=A0A0F5FUJ0_9HYPH|nr:TerB family tellurite resistance protein [Devosia geojensis]KKB11857.1 hypothetical protein VE25_10345 [Devosia geojensis]
MFEALTRLFSKPEPELPDHDPKLAVAALLVHLAAVDGEVSKAEREMIRGVLMDTYEIDEGAVDTLIREASARDAEAVDFYRFTSALSSLDIEERLEIIRMMWQVVFTDARNHELEDNMVWRVAELIGVSSRDRTVLRSQMARKG